MNDQRRKVALMAIGAEVARARKARGMTQEDLAEALGVTRTTVGRWERGLRAVNGEAMAELAVVLNASWKLVLP